jgi:hypothetical protein
VLSILRSTSFSVSVMSYTQSDVGDPREPDLSFGHALVKVIWAEQKIHQLNNYLNALFDAYRKTAVPPFDPDTGHFMVENFGMPMEVPLIAGDAIFSLRSALDCCWMGLRRAIHGPLDTKATLPRKDTREEMIGTLEKASVEQRFAGINDFVLDEVKPYRKGNEVLWLVGQADNWNKDNMIIMALTGTRVDNFSGTLPLGGRFEVSGGQFIGDFPGPVMNFGPGCEVENNPDLTFDVFLVSRKPVDERPLMPFLFAALKDTSEAVNAFIEKFGKVPQAGS